MGNRTQQPGYSWTTSAGDVAPRGPFDGVVDAGGRACLPELIDLHVHLCWDGSADPATVNARDGHELTLLRMARHAEDTLARGVTTVRDVGSIADLSLVLEHAIRGGVLRGPRLVACGRTLVMTGGHDPFWGVFCDGPGACVKGVRGQAYRSARVIKVAATGGVYGRAEGEDVGTSELGLEELRAACAEAHRLGLRVAAHAVGRDGIDNSVAAGCATIEHGIFASDEALRRMASEGRLLTPTLYIYRGIAEGGGPITPGARPSRAPSSIRGPSPTPASSASRSRPSRTQGSPGARHPALFAELRELVSRGKFTPLDAITAAPATNARALGLDGEIGTLRPGRQADILIAQGNPARDVTALERPWAVMQNGQWVRTPDGRSP